MNLFERKFSILFEQPEETEAVIPPPPSDSPAPTSDKETIASIGNDVPNNPEIDHKHEQNERMNREIQDWVAKLNGFIEDLNGLDPKSFQAKLNAAPCDTLFQKIAQSEGKKISRIARDLSGLSETLKGFLLSSKEK